MSKYKFELGTLVVITKSGQVYDTYPLGSSIAPNFKLGQEPDNNSVGKIIKRIKHINYDRNLYVVRVNTTDFIMDEIGIQKVSKLTYELLR